MKPQWLCEKPTVISLTIVGPMTWLKAPVIRSPGNRLLTELLSPYAAKSPGTTRLNVVLWSRSKSNLKLARMFWLMT